MGKPGKGKSKGKNKSRGISVKGKKMMRKKTEKKNTCIEEKQ